MAAVWKSHAGGVVALAALLSIGCASPVLPRLAPPPDRAAEMLDAYRESAARREALLEQEAEEVRSTAPTPANLLSQGDRFRESGELASALLAYVQAHEVDRDATTPLERVAFVHLRREPERAALILGDLAAEHPEKPSVHTGLALAYVAQDDFVSARASLIRAIELDPSSATPRCLLGVIHDRLGEHGAAREAYQIALELRPSDYSILNNIAVSYLLDAQAPMAIDPLRRAIVLEPKDPALHNNLGLALALSGYDKEALAEFLLAGSQAEAYNNLGYARYLRGDYRQAIESYERALDVRGDGVLRVIRNLELAKEALGSSASDEAGTL